jgi:predicted dehydrogenase
MKTRDMDEGQINRRGFLGTAAGAFMIVPGSVLAANGSKAPSDTLNIGVIGAGGMGNANTNNIAGEKIDPGNRENIVALCDVDDVQAAKTYEQFPDAKRYRDFRVMLDKEKGIDAVIIATPDHTHTVAAMAAMQLGKHVYVQKPLTRLVSEARLLTETARKYGVATQMGNQGHSGDGVRRICEWIWSGAIGDVHTVHAWTDRPVWPQGVAHRPTETPPVPDTLSWDLWLGPAPYRDFHPGYLPFSWRAYWDFGSGALGDMACHILDPVFSALKLKYPESVEGSCSTFVSPEKLWDKVVNTETFPRSAITHYQFPARPGMSPVEVIWYDGGLRPVRPDELDVDVEGLAGNGVIFEGTDGKIMCGTYGNNPTLLPTWKMKYFDEPDETIPRIEGNHEQNWAAACKGGEPASSNFDYSGPLTEMVVMGNLATKYPNRKLLWDGENMRVTNFPEANDFVKMQYRSGWEV